MCLCPANNKVFKDYIRRENYEGYNLRSNANSQPKDNWSFLNITNKKEMALISNKNVISSQVKYNFRRKIEICGSDILVLKVYGY